MQASLEAEARGKADALRSKKKLESDINELEVQKCTHTHTHVTSHTHTHVYMSCTRTAHTLPAHTHHIERNTHRMFPATHVHFEPMTRRAGLIDRSLWIVTGGSGRSEPTARGGGEEHQEVPGADPRAAGLGGGGAQTLPRPARAVPGACVCVCVCVCECVSVRECVHVPMLVLFQQRVEAVRPFEDL